MNYKRHLATAAVTVMAATFAHPATEAPGTRGLDLESGLLGARASVDLASAYVFRGQTLNDGMTLQPEVAARVWWLSAGIWANIDIDDYQDSVDPYDVSETRLYADCEACLGKTRLGVRYTRYLDRLTHTENLRNRLRNREWTAEERAVLEEFLASAGEATEIAAHAQVEDDSELSFRWAVDGTVSPSVIVHRGIDGNIDGQTYVEGGLTWTYFDQGGWLLNVAAFGAYVEEVDGESGFSHMRFTHTITWKILRATFTYLQAIDDDILVDAADGGPYDIRNYGTIGAYYEF